MRRFGLIVAIVLIAPLLRAQDYAFNSNTQPGVNVKTQFGAKGDLRTCQDVVTTASSAVITSASQCQFTQADVGKWVQVPRAGDSFNTGLSAQISSVQSLTQATLSVAATNSVTTASVLSYTDLVIGPPSTFLASSFQTVCSALLPFVPRQVGTTLTITGGTNFTPGAYTIYEVDPGGCAELSGNAGTVILSSGGTATAPLYTTIATGDYAAITSAATYACSHPYTRLVFPPGVYYLEKYRIDAGVNANGVTDIFWTGCHDVVISGYGASVKANGSFRRLNDTGGGSYENTVNPFVITATQNITIMGLELDGSGDYTTVPGGVAEGSDYGIRTGSSDNLTLKDINAHDWPTDGVYIGRMQAPNYRTDQNITLDNVWSHNDGRNALTIGNVQQINILNYKCSQIGLVFEGLYTGHQPRACVDIEPPTAQDYPIGGIYFNGGYMANGFGGVGVVSTPNCCEQVVMQGMSFYMTSPSNLNSQVFAIPNSRWSVIKDNIFINGEISCGGSTLYSPNIIRIDITGNIIYSPRLKAIYCSANDNRVRPVHVLNNQFIVGASSYNGPSSNPSLGGFGYAAAPQNGDALNFDFMQEVAGNTIYIDSSAKFSGNVNVVTFKNTESVHDNIYSTNLTNAADAFAVSYANTRYWRNERTLNPTLFNVPSSDGGGANMTFDGNLTLTAPVTPTAPTVTCTGGVCAGGSYSYKIVGRVGASGVTAASAAGTVAQAPTTFDSTHFSTISWPYVKGADSYDVYCTVGCSTLGKVNAQPISQNYFADKTGVGDTTTAPSVASGVGKIVADSSVYSNTQTSQVAAISDTTMVTVGASAQLYRFTGTINCDTTSAAATATLNLKHTDTGSTAQTVSITDTCTTLVATGVPNMVVGLRAKAATNITYGVTIANTPTYDVDVRLEKM